VTGIALVDAEEINGAARKPVDPRHRHHITRGKPVASILRSWRRSARVSKVSGEFKERVK
jgi:hypothetical protein